MVAEEIVIEPVYVAELAVGGSLQPASVALRVLVLVVDAAWYVAVGSVMIVPVPESDVLDGVPPFPLKVRLYEYPLTVPVNDRVPPLVVPLFVMVMVWALV